MSHARVRCAGETCLSALNQTFTVAGIIVSGYLAYSGVAIAEPMRFDIPAQGMAKSLVDFGTQAHLRITVAPEAADNLRAPALHGIFEPSAALAIILGTELSFEFVDADDVVVRKVKKASAVAPPDPPPQTDRGLEEIVVTAQKYSQKLQATPLSITAFGAADLQKMGFTNFSDLTNKVPSLAITPYAFAGSILEVFIRGVGQSDVVNISRDPGVGIYLDDVYLARSTALTTDLGDLDRVEVLRGPQGTLYGRNTIGGAVKFVTAAPSGKFDAKQSLDAGNFGYVRSLTSVDLPEYAGLSLKATFVRSDIDGWVRNRGTGGDFDAKDDEGYRLALRWRPHDDFMVDYAFDYATQHGTPGYLQRGYDYPSQDYPGVTDTAPLQAARVGQSWRPVDVSLKDDFKSYGHALTLTWDATDSVTVKAVTAFREDDSNFTLDTAEAFNTPQIEYYVLAERQLSQELILSGTDQDMGLKYTAGLLGFAESGSQVYGFINNPFLTHLPQVSDLSLVPGSARNQSAGAYGNLTWVPPTLDSRLSLIFGGRFSWDHRYASGGFIQSSGSVHYTSFDPSLTLDYRWSEDLHSYFKYSQGYRAGGFNLYNVVLRPFQPENLSAFEVGLKSSWWNDRLRFNIDGFDEIYRDIQVNTVSLDPVLHSLVTVTQNLGRATYKGIETDLAVVPFDGLTLTANYSYLNASTRSSLTPLPFAPHAQYNLGAEYSFGAIGPGVLTGIIGWSWIGRENAGGATLPGYGLLDARLRLSEIPLGDGKLSVSLWSKNLADRAYLDVNSGAGAIAFGEPRSFGANLTYTY